MTSDAFEVAGRELRPHCVGLLSLGSHDGVGLCEEDSERCPFNACNISGTVCVCVLIVMADTSDTFCEHRVFQFFLWFQAFGMFATTDWDLCVGTLGVFAELRRATMSCVISLCTFVCLSVRMQQLGFHWTYFHVDTCTVHCYHT